MARHAGHRHNLDVNSGYGKVQQQTVIFKHIFGLFIILFIFFIYSLRGCFCFCFFLGGGSSDDQRVPFYCFEVENGVG